MESIVSQGLQPKEEMQKELNIIFMTDEEEMRYLIRISNGTEKEK